MNGRTRRSETRGSHRRTADALEVDQERMMSDQDSTIKVTLFVPMPERIQNALLILIFSSILTGAVSAQGNDRDVGIALFRSGEYSRCVAVFRKAVETDEVDGLAWRYLGACLLKLGKDDEAREIFDKRRVSNPELYAEHEKIYDSPLKITRIRYAPYTEEARRLSIRGTVLLAVEYRADGQIGFVFPVQKLEAGLTENAIRAARETPFEPAILNGKPVTVVQLRAYRFDIY